MVNSASRGLSSTSKISTTLSFMVLSCFRKGKIECCPFIDFTLCPNSSAVALNDSLHDGKTYACPFEFIFTMQALEDPKQLVHIFDVESGAVIADEINIFLIAPFCSHFDDGTFFSGREFDRVGN